jgi:pyrroline-5-carboxylate reductase
MGEAVATHAIAAGFVGVGDLVIAERIAARRDEVAARLGIAYMDPAEAVKAADVTVLAVKPQDFGALAVDIAARLPSDSVAVSIMAGVPLGRIRDTVGHTRIVRAMPNTPAQIGRGVTVWYAPPDVADEHRAGLVRPLLAALGAEFEVADEKYIDMATAVNGSGPAFVFLVIEALIDAAVQIGIPRPLASGLVLGTVGGATEYARTSERHVAELRNQVTSPGGTTAAGLFELESAAVRAAFARAVQAAYDRAKALGG